MFESKPVFKLFSICHIPLIHGVYDKIVMSFVQTYLAYALNNVLFSGNPAVNFYLYTSPPFFIHLFPSCFKEFKRIKDLLFLPVVASFYSMHFIPFSGVNLCFYAPCLLLPATSLRVTCACCALIASERDHTRGLEPPTQT